MLKDKKIFHNKPYQSVPFYKMHALGNDFVIVDIMEQRKYGIENLRDEEIRYICSRKYGIGCDQLIFFEILEDKTVSVKIHNSDGSTAYNCGNGMRCVMWLIYILSDKKTMNIDVILETNRRVGLKVLQNFNIEKQMLGIEGEVFGQMGEYKIKKLNNYYGFNGYYVDVGNQHFVTFIDDLNFIDMTTATRMSKLNNILNNGANISFVNIDDNNSQDVFVRVYERGVGETNACGSAAAAVFAALLEERYQSDDNKNITFFQSKTSVVVGCEKNYNNKNILYVIGSATLVGNGFILC
jgi:diaminopimelate epimerase